MCAIRMLYYVPMDSIQYTSLDVLLWGHLLVKQGIHKNPKKIHLNFGKDLKLTSPGSVDGRNVASGMYQTPLSIGIVTSINSIKVISLITTEISLVPHTKDLFKGTSSTRQGGEILAPV